MYVLKGSTKVKWTSCLAVVVSVCSCVWCFGAYMYGVTCKTVMSPSQMLGTYLWSVAITLRHTGARGMVLHLLGRGTHHRFPTLRPL